MGKKYNKGKKQKSNFTKRDSKQTDAEFSSTLEPEEKIKKTKTSTSSGNESEKNLKKK